MNNTVSLIVVGEKFCVYGVKLHIFVGSYRTQDRLNRELK